MSEDARPGAGFAPSPARLAPGARIGSYEVMRRINSGGMAELYAAKRVGIEGFEKVVALKRILPHLALNPEFVAMFLAEARLAARLEHPNIVHVSDIGTDGTNYFIAMAYIHGKDALALLRQVSSREERLPIAHAITIALGLCAGLHHAHEQVDLQGKPLGIVHRDVSPANVLVTWDGNVKVVDFGIAKAAAHTGVTRAGVRKGKASYMSPEQCRGRKVDRRTDIWAIGVVLYELTTMARLVHADDELAILHKIVTADFVPPAKRVPGYPPQLAGIINRCLQQDPARRFPTALALRRALQSFADGAHLSTSTDRLGEYMRGVFGEQAQQLPWAGDAEDAQDAALAALNASLADDELLPTTTGPKSARPAAPPRGGTELVEPMPSPSPAAAAAVGRGPMPRTAEVTPEPASAKAPVHTPLSTSAPIPVPGDPSAPVPVHAPLSASAPVSVPGPSDSAIAPTAAARAAASVTPTGGGTPPPSASISGQIAVVEPRPQDRTEIRPAASVTSASAFEQRASTATDGQILAERETPPRPATTVKWVALGLSGLAIGALALVLMRPAPPEHAASTPEPTPSDPSAKAAVASDDDPAAAVIPASARKALELLNDAEGAAGLGYAQRQRLIKIVRASPAATEELDERLQARLDLAQASDADDPCACFSAALAVLADSPTVRTADLEAVRTAKVPSGEGCEGLELTVLSTKSRLDAKPRDPP